MNKYYCCFSLKVPPKSGKKLGSARFRQGFSHFFASLSLFFILPALAMENSLSPPLYRGKNAFHTEIHTSYYYTDSNYTQTFKSRPLSHLLELSEGADEPFFQYMSMEAGLGYTVAKWLSAEIFAKGFWFAQSGDGTRLRFSNWQIQRGGGALRSEQSLPAGFGFIPEFSFSFPFLSLNWQTQKPITDDGSLHFTPAIWLYAVIEDLIYPFVYTGFKIRTQSLSSLLKWKAGLMLKADIAELGFYSYGFWSLTRDKSSGQLGDRAQLLKRVNAGSLRFFSSNPGAIGFTGWLSWHFPYVSLRLSGDIDINGTHYSKGYSFLASLIFQLGGRGEPKMRDMFNQQESDFQPRDMESDESINSAFENQEEQLMQESMEKALKEAEHLEEEKMEQEEEN